MSIETKHIGGRRALRFASVREVLADAERVAVGAPKTLGNWSPGQIFLHLARGIDASIDGVEMKLPWPMRLVGRLARGRILRGAMRAGINLPPAGADYFNPGPTTTEAGLASLRAAILRLEGTSQRAASPLLGRLTAAEWEQFHLRHAELHLSFIVEGGRHG